MKRIFVTFLFTVLMVCLLSAQGILVTCAKPTHDFGEIAENAGKVTHVFRIKNSGKKPLAIIDVSASCGCTVTNWSKKPILPGKEGEVSVTFDPKGRPGAFSKSVTVVCSGMKKGFNLRIRGRVVTP